MIQEIKFEDKTKSKQCDCAMQKMTVGRNYCYKGKTIYSVTCSIWGFCKCDVIESPTPSWF